jgi:hypothetical protein
VIGAIGGDIFARALHLDRMRLSRKVRQIETTVSRAATEARMPWESLDETLQSDPTRAELYARVLEAAGAAMATEKLRAFSQLLASVVLDDSKLDIAFIISAALAEMEQPHIRALALINGGIDGEWLDLPGWLENRPDFTVQKVLEPPILPEWAPLWAADGAEFTKWLPTECGGAEAFPVIRGTLVHHGLIEQHEVLITPSPDVQSNTPGAVWVTTTLGYRILNLLHPTAPSWVETEAVRARQEAWLDSDDSNNLLEWNFQADRWRRWEARLRDKRKSEPSA